MTNLDKLKKLMLDHRLSVSEVAKMLGIRAKNVYPWFTSRNKNWSRGVSDSYIQLLEFKVKEKK